MRVIFPPVARAAVVWNAKVTATPALAAMRSPAATVNVITLEQVEDPAGVLIGQFWQPPTILTFGIEPDGQNVQGNARVMPSKLSLYTSTLFDVAVAPKLPPANITIPDGNETAAKCDRACERPFGNALHTPDVALYTST